jgi:glycosyltransferase involved in cell wall biosynthesis
MMQRTPRPRLVLRETNSPRARGDLGRLRRLAIGWVYRRADRLVALSHGVANELCAEYRVAGERIAVIHNPVEVERIARESAEARASSPPFAKRGPAILAIGRLHRQKGFDLLLRAVASLGRPDLQLVILGEGAERPALQALGAQLGMGDRLYLPGFVPDVPRWLAHADMFVLASRWEGFGHVVVEAQAAGIPVIATDCPHGPRDVVREGETGLLVSPEDVPALAKAIARLLGDPGLRHRLAAEARTDCTRFAAKRIAAVYRELFESVTAAR